VLVLNINPGGIAGGSGTQYFVGKFDGRRFINDNPVSAELWMDYGKDYYAAVSFYGAPRRIMLGWFSNWLYANETPESDWRGAMALPREISLVRTAAGIRVRQKPIAQLASIRMPVNPAAFVPAAGKPLLTLDEANRQLREGTANRTQFQIDVAFQRGTAKHFGLRVFTGAKNYTEIGVSVPDSYLYIDRTHSGTTSFSKSFPGRQDAPMDISQELRLNVLLDRSSVEVFANDGLATLADRVYPAPGDNGISFFADGEQPKIRSLKMWQIRSVWSDRGALPEGAQVIPVRKHR
jgi:sucrose-6-phosphate hydrolase SacC (GH32 family)